MIIGLTGGSGTGKSSACEFFRQRNFLIIDSDKVSREVCSPGERCLEELIQSFGGVILDSDGSLKRHALGEIVFSDKDKLKMLNKITHKYILERIRNIIEENRHKDIVLDAPLLFETGLDDVCDVKLCILSSTDNRINRICARDGISREQALKRISSQHDDNYYISGCDYALYNDRGIEELNAELKEIFGGSDVEK